MTHYSGERTRFDTATTPGAPDNLALEDIRLDLNAGRQDLVDLVLSLVAAGDGLSDIRAVLQAADWDLEDISTALSAEFQGRDDLRTALLSLGWMKKDIALALLSAVYGRVDVPAALCAGASSAIDIKTVFQAVDRMVFIDAVFSLTVTDGVVLDDMPVNLSANRPTPAFVATVAQRLAANVAEVP